MISCKSNIHLAKHRFLHRLLDLYHQFDVKLNNKGKVYSLEAMIIFAVSEGRQIPVRSKA